MEFFLTESGTVNRLAFTEDTHSCKLCENPIPAKEKAVKCKYGRLCRRCIKQLFRFMQDNSVTIQSM